MSSFLPSNSMSSLLTSSKPVESPRVIVTGAGNGLGAHIAHKYAKEGCRVACLDMNKPALDRFKVLLDTPAKETPAVDTEKMLFIECDISSEEQVKNALAQIEKAWGGIDILINNASLPHQHGINRQKKTKVEDWTTWEFNKYQEVNVTGTFIVCREAARMLETSGGCMLLMGSIRAHVADDMQEAYGASKSATIGLTRSLAASLGPRGVRVNCVSPGWIDVRDAQMDRIESFPGTVPEIWTEQHKEMWVGRIGHGSDVAELCYFLTDNKKAGFISGADIDISGGARSRLAING